LHRPCQRATNFWWHLTSQRLSDNWPLGALSPLELCCRILRGCSSFNCTNMTTVGAPEKVYECVSSDAFNCLPKSQFAAAMRTGLTDANRLHGVLYELGEVRRTDIFQLKTGLDNSARRRHPVTIRRNCTRQLCDNSCLRNTYGPPKCSISSLSAVPLPPPMNQHSPIIVLSLWVGTDNDKTKFWL
jgi:hypothetical protein